MQSMPSKELTISNKLGIHARPAAQFVKTASQFDSDIRVEKDGEEVDGKSIMGLMMLAAGQRWEKQQIGKIKKLAAKKSRKTK